MDNLQNNGQVKSKNTIRWVVMIVVAVCVVGAVFLFWTRLRIRNAVEEAVRKQTRGKAMEVRDEFRKDFAVLDTINDLWGAALNDSLDTADTLKGVVARYEMSGLGYITEDLTYYDCSGMIVPAKNENETVWGITKEYFETVMEGGKKVLGSETLDSGEGIVFAIPFQSFSSRAILCYLMPKRVMRQRLLQDTEGTSWILTNENAEVLTSDEKMVRFLGEKGWLGFVENGQNWKKKALFDNDLKKNHSSVSIYKNAAGKEIFLSVASVPEFKDLFVVRISDVSGAKKEVSTSMFITTSILMLSVILLLGITVYAIISSLKNRRELYKAAFVDQLTGLPSKTKHKLDAQEMINKQDQNYVYVVFDVDNFKYINELFGYELGNRLLIHISQVLKRFTRKGELCSRVSGDNFAMLFLYDGDKEALKERIGKIFHAMTEYSEEESEFKLCSVKFACGVYNIEGAEDINKIRANANLARIESKKQVFDKIVFYNEVLKTRHVEEHELEYEAKDALENGEFIVFYQPKYNSITEKIIGAEALIRWKHAKKGMISPGQFIPMFEANGFIIDIDLFVLRKTCELISGWISRGIKPVCISVNLSRTHLYEQNLADRLEEVVKNYNIPAECIEFELTESAMYGDMSNLLGVMEEIRKKGFRLSMDDFGSGYSSLNLLRRLPVDVLKLDKDFMDDGDGDLGSRDKRIVWHVIAMAKDLEMTVLAEGVETKEQKNFLRDASCDIIQGFYFARPMPVEEFEEIYLKQIEAETL